MCMTMHSAYVGLFKRANVELDRDDWHIGDMIQVVVRATDSAVDPLARLSTDATVRIRLLDLNDNRPLVHDPVASDRVEVREDQPIFKTFHQIVASDADAGLNAELVFSILQEQSTSSSSSSSSSVSTTYASSLIGIEPTTGRLYLSGERLDFEREQSVNVTIGVMDKSSSPLLTKHTLLIVVVNINDNAPQFVSLPTLSDIDETSCSLSVYEGEWSKAPRVLHHFAASDRDTPNGSFAFDLVRLTSASQQQQQQQDLNKNMFRLERDTGKLYVNELYELDREQIDAYRLHLRVRDQAIWGTQLETSQVCTLRVLDVNDNRPLFSNAPTSEFVILPVVNELTFIHWFGASDLDAGNNATISYSLLNNDINNNLFKINSNGYLYLNMLSNSDASRQPQQQQQQQLQLNDVYELQVCVSDAGTPARLNSTLNVRIRIDPNYFKFSQSTSHNDRLELRASDVLYLDENTPNGTRIEQIQVVNSYQAIFGGARSV